MPRHQRPGAREAPLQALSCACRCRLDVALCLAACLAWRNAAPLHDCVGCWVRFAASSSACCWCCGLWCAGLLAQPRPGSPSGLGQHCGISGGRQEAPSGASWHGPLLPECHREPGSPPGLAARPLPSCLRLWLLGRCITFLGARQARTGRPLRSGWRKCLRRAALCREAPCRRLLCVAAAARMPTAPRRPAWPGCASV